MIKTLIKTLSSVLAILLLYPLSSNAGWRDEHERGWHWYESKMEEEKLKETKEAPAPAPVSHAQKLKQYRKRGEELRAKAILERSKASVTELVEWEKTMWDNSERFGAVWQAVLRERPDLDYSVTHPTTQYARHVYLDENKKKIKHSIEVFRQHFGLVFFFKGTCPYCHAMAPVINSVAKRHGLHLQGVSIDGGKLEFFDKVHPDNGLSQKFNVTMVPALFAVNPLSGDFFPIATGSISEQEIEERILQIAEFQAYQGQEGSKHAQ